jgi:small GTP-binding protein
MTLSESDDVIHGRVVLIGDSAVGKTSLVNRLIEERFNIHEQSTVGANWQLYNATVTGTRVEFQIWDTAGQEKFRSLGPLYYRNALGAVAVFDVTSRVSFESLGSWIAAFTAVAGANTVVVLSANKCDVDDDLRRVAPKEAIEWARSAGCPLFETSALTGQNVRQLFAALAEGIVNARPGVRVGGPSLGGVKRTEDCC